MPKPSILLTGFTPFAHHAENPSGKLAAEIAAKFGSDIHGRVLPVDYHAARALLLETLHELRPVACLSMGLAPGDRFRVETHARKPEAFLDLPGAEDYQADPPAFFHAVCQEHSFVELSSDAGRFVCESVYWTLLDHAAHHPELCSALFLHIPALSAAWPYPRILDFFQTHLWPQFMNYWNDKPRS